jgi:hypothetical protein
MKNDPVPAHSKRFSRYARDASRGTVSNSEIVAIMIHVSDVTAATRWPPRAFGSLPHSACCHSSWHRWFSQASCL